MTLVVCTLMVCIWQPLKVPLISKAQAIINDMQCIWLTDWIWKRGFETAAFVEAHWFCAHLSPEWWKLVETLSLFSYNSNCNNNSSIIIIIIFLLLSKPLHRGAFCQFPFQRICYYGSNKSTGKEPGKKHLCALLQTYWNTAIRWVKQ